VAPLAIYIAATGAGLWFFFWLLRWRPKAELAPTGPLLSEAPRDAPGDAPGEQRARRLASPEATLPRWLRPSVQKARGQPGVRRRSWE
jgi:hypothetical protein